MERRLAAIMAADVVGYARLIRADEEGTLRALRSLRADIIDPKLNEHNGRIVKLMGDGVLVEFPSVVDAVRAALATQQLVGARNAGLPEAKRIVFRVGINLGDVVIDGDDIHGDGVNVASRLEGLAEPGGLCVSAAVHDQVRNRIDLAFEDLGDQSLKNIDQPVRVWRWPVRVADDTPRFPRPGPSSAADRPSIAVLPFDNMSGDPEQDYFADGITEDIITALSRYRWFFVSARNSTFAYRGTAIDIKQIGRELGVRYVLEGSVRKAGTRVRVTAQLIEAATGNHIWADRYDRVLEDIFDLQDEIQQAIVTAVEPELTSAEYRRVSEKSPDKLAAWDLLQQAMWHVNRRTRPDASRAEELFAELIARDASIARAYSGFSLALVTKVAYGWSGNPEAELRRATELAQEAVRKDDSDPFNHDVLARTFTFRNDPKNAIREHRVAMTLNPNSAYTHFGLGEALQNSGRHEEAVAHLVQGVRLSPRDPLVFLMQTLKAVSLDCLGRTAEAEAAYLEGLSLRPDEPSVTTVVADFYVRHDRLADAQEAIRRARQLNPDYDVGYVRNSRNPRVLAGGEALIDNLRLAGLPE